MQLPAFIPMETLVMAFGTVRANKVRSFLTVLGIVIGVVVVIAIASILTGLRGRIVSMIEEYGTNNIYAFHLTTGPRLGPRERSEYARKPLTPEDSLAILSQAGAVEDVANVVFLGRLDRTIKYRGQNYRRGSLQGVSPSYAGVTNMSLREGRFITDIDDAHRRDVMVIGVNVADALFPFRTSIAGTVVELSGRAFEIVGVLEKRKSSFFGENEEDNAIIIPFRTGRRLSPNSTDMLMHIQAKSEMLPAALNQVEEILRRQRGVKYNEPNNFDLSTADSIVQQFDQITMFVGLFAIAISAVGLLVGGIGVMNIMLVSVTERTREIGIRKAIGARKGDIIRQFLFEAMMLTSLGGVLGVVFAVIVSYLIMLLIPDLPAAIPLWAVVSGMFVSTSVGLIFGVWPAKKAANLDPIECLRYE